MVNIHSSEGVVVTFIPDSNRSVVRVKLYVNVFDKVVVRSRTRQIQSHAKPLVSQ